MKRVGLRDIAPQLGETVVLAGHAMQVTGISVAGIMQLLQRFPALAVFMGGGEDVNAEKIIGLGGEVLGAVIAAGCGDLGDVETETIASALAADAQVDLLSTILRLTFPTRLDGFFQKVAGLGGLLATASAPTAAEAKSLDGSEGPITIKPRPKTTTVKTTTVLPQPSGASSDTTVN